MDKFYERCAGQLIAYVQFWAWLHTPPKIEPQQTLKNTKAQQTPSRLQKSRSELGDVGYMPDMPDVEGLENVIDYFFECGPALFGSSGPLPLSHCEIAAWKENTGRELSPWEAKLLRQMSIEFVDWSAKAKDPSCLSPIAEPELTAEARDNVSQRVSSFFKGLVKNESRLP